MGRSAALLLLLAAAVAGAWFALPDDRGGRSRPAAPAPTADPDAPGRPGPARSTDGETGSSSTDTEAEVGPGDPAGAVLSGTVLLEPEGVPAQAVLLLLEDGESEKPVPREFVSSTESDGSFRMEGIPAGTWLLVVFAKDRMPRNLPRIVLRAGERRSGMRIGLIRGGRIEGVVRGSSGEPMEGVEVVAAPEDGTRRIRETDPDGTYAFAGLEPGAWRLSTRNSEGVRIELADGITIRRDFVLAEPATLVVDLVNREGDRVEGAVLLRPPGGEWQDEGRRVEDAPLEIPDLVPGDYELWAEDTPDRSRSRRARSGRRP